SSPGCRSSPKRAQQRDRETDEAPDGAGERERQRKRTWDAPQTSSTGKQHKQAAQASSTSKQHKQAAQASSCTAVPGIVASSHRRIVAPSHRRLVYQKQEASSPSSGEK
ncbi:hypothetical protein K432DRAFT_395721, partial [Lepidopterella palustris CBS 459.81]